MRDDQTILRRAARFVGWAIAAVSIAFLVVLASRNLHDLPAIALTRVGVATFAVAVAANVAMVVLWAFAWTRLLVSAGATTTTSASFVNLGLSQVGKYAPGKVAHLFGRVALAAAEGMPAGLVLVTILIETALVVAAAAACGSVAVAMAHVPLPFAPRPTTLVVIAGLVASAPLVLPLAVRKMQPVLLERLGVGAGSYPHAGASAVTFAVHVVNLLGQALILVLLARGVFGLEFDNIALAVAAFCLAWLAGFIVPIVPAGIGVRETVLATTIALGSDISVGLALAAAHRAATMLGDGAAFALAAAIRTLGRPIKGADVS